MRRLIDLTGQRFGRLTVLSLHHTNDGSFWTVICDCGNTFITKSSYLRNGNVNSCGCLKSEICRLRSLDLTGEVFERLTVIKKLESEEGVSYSECLCECGNIIKVRTSNLKSKNTKSCGCLEKENKQKRWKNLSGKYFGNLQVIKFQRKEKKEIYYLCKCVCGNFVEVNGRNLKGGGTKSCGCLSESFIAAELKKYFGEYYGGVSEYKILKNPQTNYYLPYDIYLPNENIFIEIQGLQHYNETNFWNNITNSFKKLKERDKLKKQYAKKNGTFIEIDLRKIKTVEQAIEKIEKIIKDKK